MEDRPNYMLEKKANEGPWLVNDWGGGRTYDRNSVLPDLNGMRAGEFVAKHLLGQAAGLPGLSCQEGGELTQLAWDFLSRGIPMEVLIFAEVFHDLKTRGIELPPVEFGPSMAQQRLGAL